MIVRFGNQQIANGDALLDAVRSLPPGAKVQVTFRRQGQTFRVSLTLGSAES